MTLHDETVADRTDPRPLVVDWWGDPLTDARDAAALMEHNRAIHRRWAKPVPYRMTLRWTRYARQLPPARGPVTPNLGRVPDLVSVEEASVLNDDGPLVPISLGRFDTETNTYVGPYQVFSDGTVRMAARQRIRIGYLARWHRI